MKKSFTVSIGICCTFICTQLLADPVYTLDSNTGRYISFDDYNLTTDGTPPTWKHFGTNTASGSQPGTNHVHKSGWSFVNCRMGRLNTGTSVDPVLNGNAYVPNTNYCAYFQNSLSAVMTSPVFTNGIGTIYFDIVSVTAPTTVPIIKIYVSTNLVGAIWEEVDSLTLNTGQLIRYTKTLNITQPVAIKFVRTTVNGTLKDIFVAAIDNIRVSEPPADVIMDKGLTPFNVYPSINSSMNLQFRIDNAPGPSTTTSATRTNVLLVSRWNYLNQKTTAWVANKMQCVSTGDGAGNGELWQPLPSPALSVFPDAGDLEYYFLCYFNGTYYQSYDYTVYPPVLNPALFPPENKSPRLYNAAGITALSGTPTNNFIFPLRLFPSSHDSVTAMLSANGQPPMALAMTLVGTNKWQAKYDVVNYPGVTNLLWYFEATGAYTNAFTTTSEKSYWQNTSLSRIQNGALPYGDNCGVTDGTITNMPGDWFGVTVTPGESSYVMFTLDTAKPSYLAGRGEYQNFNGWNMGAAAQNFFTDSDDKYPKVSYSQNFSSGWSPSYLTGLSNWFGTATFDGQTASLRTGPEPVLDQSMYWNAGTFQYLVERTAIAGFVADAEFASQRRNQGIRLFGNEGNPALGTGYYQGSAQQQNGINGVGTVIYKARLSRPLATDTKYNINVAWRKTDMQRTNYVIRTSMYATSMSPERPSMSMIAYYQDMYRFYEYRNGV